MTFDNSDNYKYHNIMWVVVFFKCHYFWYIWFLFKRLRLF